MRRGRCPSPTAAGRYPGRVSRCSAGFRFHLPPHAYGGAGDAGVHSRVLDARVARRSAEVSTLQVIPLLRSSPSRWTTNWWWMSRSSRTGPEGAGVGGLADHPGAAPSASTLPAPGAQILAAARATRCRDSERSSCRIRRRVNRRRVASRKPSRRWSPPRCKTRRRHAARARAGAQSRQEPNQGRAVGVDSAMQLKEQHHKEQLEKQKTMADMVKSARVLISGSEPQPGPQNG